MNNEGETIELELAAENAALWQRITALEAQVEQLITEREQWMQERTDELCQRQTILLTIVDMLPEAIL